MMPLSRDELEALVKELEEERDAGLEVLRRVVNQFRADTFFIDYSEEDDIGQIAKALFDSMKTGLNQPLRDRIAALHKMGRDRIEAEDKVKHRAKRIAALETELSAVAAGLESATKDDISMSEEWAEHIREVLVQSN